MKNTFNLRYPMNLLNVIMLVLAGWITDTFALVIAITAILAITVRYIDDSVDSKTREKDLE